MAELFRRLSNRKKDKKDYNDATSPPPASPSSSLSPITAYNVPIRRPANPFSRSSSARDAPPSYSPTDPNQQNHQCKPEPAEDPLSFLSTFDTKFLIDDSGSMNIGYPSRWSLVSKALGEIAPTCTTYDKDGIDIHFLIHADEKGYMKIGSTEKVHEIFAEVSPDWLTPTGRRLKEILDPYLKVCSDANEAGAEPPKPLNLIVITDGKSTDNVEAVLAAFGKKLDKTEAVSWQLGVQFCQVGDDETASEALAFLDDELAAKYECRDFVDTQRFDPSKEFGMELIMKTVFGAVNKRWDRMDVG